MAGDSEEEEAGKTVPYVLCAFTGAGVMFNLILLVWHCIKFKSHKASVFVKYGLAFLHLCYMCVGVAVSLLILYRDLGTTWLCKFGGFLMLFSTQESLWTLAITCVTVLLWKLSQEPPSRTRGKHAASHRHQKWKKPLFILSMFLKCVLLALVCMLPLVDLAFFDSNSAFYYLCTPLRLPGEHGWPYSTVILVLDWVALIIAAVSIILSIVISRRRERNLRTLDIASTTSSISSARTLSGRESRQYTVRQHVILPFSVVAWFLVLLTTNISYFSRGSVMEPQKMQWLLGFFISGTIVLHPLVTFIMVLVSHSDWLIPRAAACAKCGYCGFHKDRSGPSSSRRHLLHHDYLTSHCPKNLVSLAKLPPTSALPDKHVSLYLVQWRDSHSALTAGVMKVFAPSSLQKWRNEVNTLSRLSSLPHHPHVAQYHWQCPHNNYTAAICTFTRQIVSPETSLVCRAHYPHGTLHQFLQTRVSQLTEVVLHKITLDVASGLDHLHQIHVVHNGLTSHSIYMASIAETGGVKVVIGDFECSYEVPVDPLRQSRLSLLAKQDSRRSSKTKYPHPLWSISSEIDRDNGKFAPDIRSFGLVVLEMLMSMGEYNKQVFNKRKRISRSLDDLYNLDCQSEERSKVTAELDPHIGQSCKDCKCSSKVKDIRACADKPDSDVRLFTNFIDILNDNEKEKKIKAGQSSSSMQLSSSWQGSAFSSQLPKPNTKHQASLSDSPSGNHHHSVSLPENLKACKASQESMEKCKAVESIQLRALPPVPSKPPRSSIPHSSQSSHNTSKESNTASESTYTDTADTSDSNTPKSLAQRRKKAHLSHMNRTLRKMKSDEVSDEDLDVEIPIYNDDFAGAEYTKPSHVYLSVKESDTPPVNTAEKSSSDVKLKVKRPSCIPCETVASGSSEENSPATPSSEDLYNTSLGSLASFETIYEDEESPNGDKAKGKPGPSGMPITRIAHQRRFQRVHPVRKRAEEAHAQKRLSTSSLDGSIGSGDSGFGSSNHCDLLSTCSDVSQLFKSGTRDTVYAENASASDSDSYSLVKLYLDGRGTTKHTDSGIESNAESIEELGRNPKSPQSDPEQSAHFPDLKLMKKPCTKKHPHLCSHPHSYMHPAAQDPASKAQQCITTGSTDPGSQQLHNDQDRSSIYATKESPRETSSEQQRPACCCGSGGDKDCQFCGKDSQHIHIQDSIHPAIRNQYQYRPPPTSSSSSHQPLPKLGVSAVHSARRMSAMSSTCSSVTSGSTETLDSLFRSSDRKLTIGSISELTDKHKQQRPLSDLPEHYGGKEEVSVMDQLPKKSASYSIDKTQPSVHGLSPAASSDLRAQSQLSQSSFSSSIVDLINDSDLIIKEIMEKENQFFATHQRQSSQGAHIFREKPRSGLGMQQMQQFRQVVRRGGQGTSHQGAEAAIAGGNRNMGDVLEKLKDKGNLGFIAQQMLPLLSDCWLEDPAPSTEQILKRLEHVLPTASV